MFFELKDGVKINFHVIDGGKAKAKFPSELTFNSELHISVCSAFLSTI